MRTTWLVALASVFALGCAGDVSKQIEQLADRACACKDATCADQVVDDLVQFAKDNPTASGDQHKGVEQAQRLVKCAVTAGSDPTKMAAKMKTLRDPH